ncbi:MAG: hypothetical protein ABR929_10235 [Roseiarcus sp.]|jgi:hypothetical protein
MSAQSSSKYWPLTVYLRAQRGAQVRMSFAEIERVLGGKLPPSAASHRAWWSNNPSNNVMTKAWLEAGFHSEQVDLSGRKLVFRRVRLAAPSPAGPTPKQDSSAEPPLFGWLRGTVVSTGDLTEPADPEWAKRIDDERQSAA